VSARAEARLWVIQRATAAFLAVCVVVHLATIIYAVRGGLSAAEILSRTRGSLAWGGFYGAFVLAAAAHGSIGVRAIAMEWLGFGKRAALVAMIAVAAAFTILGLRAVYAVVAS
jgi:succinate dehydrogenase subunit C